MTLSLQDKMTRLNEIRGGVQTDQLRSASWEQRGSRGSYARLQRACSTKYEPDSNRCSRFNWSCSCDRYFRGFSFPGLSKANTGATAVLVDQPQFGFLLCKTAFYVLP
jgi:hypothetical protein